MPLNVNKQTYLQRTGPRCEALVNGVAAAAAKMAVALRAFVDTLPRIAGEQIGARTTADPCCCFIAALAPCCSFIVLCVFFGACGVYTGAPATLENRYGVFEST